MGKMFCCLVLVELHRLCLPSSPKGVSYEEPDAIAYTYLVVEVLSVVKAVSINYGESKVSSVGTDDQLVAWYSKVQESS